MRNNYWISRTLCDVLEDMRKCTKTSNYTALTGLIEEVQIKANRMEAGLGDKKDLLRMEQDWHDLKRKLKKLNKKIKRKEKKLSNL